MRSLYAALLFLFLAASGQAAEPQGVVFVVGGVGGWDPLGPCSRLVLPLKLPHEVREFYWNHGVGQVVRDLQDTPHLLTQAGALADQITAVKAAAPDRLVYLVAHSAGTGVAVAALSKLPAATVERVVLLSPALSPHFNLCAALRATRREIVCYNSCLDRFWLDWGTTQFGTVDGIRTRAAGVEGFRPPNGLSPAERGLYARLVQIEWQPAHLLQCHGGLHGSTVMPGFLWCHVAPWLRP